MQTYSRIYLAIWYTYVDLMSQNYKQTDENDRFSKHVSFVAGYGYTQSGQINMIKYLATLSDRC